MPDCPMRLLGRLVLISAGKKIETYYWGNYNPAARAVIALYEAMPQFTMHEIRADKV